jgi:hypothetical protein
MSEAEVENTDAFLDPAYAEAEAIRAFGAYLEAAASLRDYGRDLFKRLVATVVRSLPDLVVVGLLRGALSALDAWHLAASHGAAQAGKLHLRTLLEAFLYTEWILKRGVEPWARRLYVANVRDARRHARRLIPGTEEYRLLNAAWESEFGNPYSATAEAEAVAREQDRSALNTLEHSANENIYREFEAFFASHRREAEFYELGDDAVPSIFALATALGRRAEYYSLYEVYSDVAHGSRTDLHFHKSSDGHIVFEPVRNPASLKDDVSFAVMMPIRLFHMLLEHYRPDECSTFAQNYVERWRAFMNPPSVQVNEQIVSFP